MSQTTSSIFPNSLKRDFYSSYSSNLSKILEIKEKISGTHAIDINQARIWIHSQINAERRRAALLLLSNTYYITFDMLFKSIGKIVKKIYSSYLSSNSSAPSINDSSLSNDNNIENKKEFALYVGPTTKSNYFIAVIVIYFIRLLGYKDPEILYSLEKEDLKSLDAKKKEMLIIDDMAYTGIQLGKMFRKIREVNKDINIIVGLAAINETAISSLKEKGIKLHVDIIIPSLKKKLSKEDFLLLTYYFSPWNEGLTQVSCYFDHKIGEDLSVFRLALLYGPILPSHLGYDDLLDNDIYISANELVDIEWWQPPSGRELTDEERKRERDQEHIFDEELRKYTVLMDKIIEKDKAVEKEIKETKFVPFIKGCVLPENIEKIFKEKNFTYLEFLSRRIITEKERKEREENNKRNKEYFSNKEEAEIEKRGTEEKWGRWDEEALEAFEKGELKLETEEERSLRLEKEDEENKKIEKEKVEKEKYLEELYEAEDSCIHPFYKSGILI